jgi:ubiquinone/menaquinone biosynthesis C-methylase UbiE
MTTENLKSFAEQLRRPHGILGVQVGEKMNEGNRLMNLETINQLEAKSDDHILEIGMGNGFFVRNIVKDKAIKYSGCDFSEAMVSESIMRNRQLVKNGVAQFILANANSLPYASERFEKVLTVNTIYFWDNIKIILSEVKRVLKNNGILIISLRPQSIMDNLPITKHGFLTFSKAAIIELLTENGFKIIDVIEKEDDDHIFAGKRFKNGFFIVKASKPG